MDAAAPAAKRFFADPHRRWEHTLNKRRNTLASGLAAAWLAAGCAGNPSTQPPALSFPLDTQFSQAGAQAEPGDIASFWRAFNDAPLTALVEQALAANTDVKIAQARLQEARADAGEADAGLLPSVGVNAGVAEVKQVGPGDAARQVTVGASFNWELDFFGRNRSARESAAALVRAGEAGVDAAQRLVTAEVATQYINLRGLQQRLRVAQEALMNQRESLRITGAREQYGRGTPLDVARARALVESTEASLPALQAAIERCVYRLATLTGQTPRAVSAAVATGPTEPAVLLPTLPLTDLSKLPAGTPQTLLQRRPDIRAAQAQLLAAEAGAGVARADLYPRISLTGLLGFTNSRVADLFQHDSRSSSAGAGITWTVLDFGRIRSRIRASEARSLQALRTYEQTVQLALEETEGALSSFSRGAEQATRLENAAIASEEAARLARIRFDAGATDFLTVLDAERGVLQSRDALVQAQAGTLASLVGVYRALGGGWQPGVPAP